MSTDASLPCTLFAINDFLLYNTSSKCEYIQAACSPDTLVIDFFNLYYCTLAENWLIFLIISTLFIFISFYWISTTAEDYLEPALSAVAEKLHFSPSLAGVTLVSLANGAPDVFAALAAGGLESHGILVPMGALFGAGIFTCSVVLAACILASKNKVIKAEPWALNRDCMFYLVSAVYLFVLGIYGEINITGIVGLFVIYAFYIGAVVYHEAQLKREEKIRAWNESLYPESETKFFLKSGDDSDEDVEGLNRLVKSEYIMNNEAKAYLGSELDSKQISPIGKLLWQYNTFKSKFRCEMKNLKQKGLTDNLVAFLTIPYKIAVGLTIPASNPSQWSKPKAILQPFTISVFLLWQFGLLETLTNNTTNFYLYIITCTAISLYTWKHTCSIAPPQGLMNSVLLLVSFMSSALWLNFVAHTIIDFVNLVSIFTGLPLNYLGLTLLAWGNSIPDLYVNMALVKKGMNQTALSGVFGGQFFNLVVGFGVSLVRQIWSFGPREFKLIEMSQAAMINLVLIWWLVLMLAGTVIFSNRNNNYKLTRNFGIYLVSLYAWFFIFVTAMSL